MTAPRPSRPQDSNTSTPQYWLIRLPHAHSNPAIWSALVARYRAFRLHSLRTAPEAFASTYAGEVAFESSVWEQRLRNPLACTLVAVAVTVTDSAEGPESVATGSRGHAAVSTTDDGHAAGAHDDGASMRLLLAAPWAGTTVIMGPREDSFVQAGRSPWDIVVSSATSPSTTSTTAAAAAAAAGAAGATTATPSGDELSASPTLFCHLSAVFTDPRHRGRGIAHSLLEGAVAHGLASAQQRRDAAAVTAAQLCCTVLVDAANGAAAALYAKCGFVVVGEETAVSAAKERADGTPLPEREMRVLRMARWTRLEGA